MKKAAKERLGVRELWIVLVPVLVFLIYGGKALYDHAAVPAVAAVPEVAAPAPVPVSAPAVKAGSNRQKAAKKNAAGNVKPVKKGVAQRLELVVSELESGKTDFEAINRLGVDLDSLADSQVDELISKAIERHPLTKSELTIGWAKILSDKGHCGLALRKLDGMPEQDGTFWENTRVQTLQKCKSR